MSRETEVLADLADSVPGALYRIESTEFGKWSFVFLSSGIEDLYGYSAEDVLADQMLLNRCMLEEDVVGYAEANLAAYENMSVLDHEYRIRCRSGEVRWIGVRAVPRGGDGATVSWSGIMLDITDRKQIEDALVRSETRFRALFNEVPQGIVLRDGLGKVVGANPAALRLLQTSLPELLGTPEMDPVFSAITTRGEPVPDEDHPSLVALRTGRPVENKILGSMVGDGERKCVWLRVNASLVWLGGKIDQVVTTLEDVTEGFELTRVMREEAETDYLTKVPNRRSFMARLSVALERARADPERSFAVLAIDLDLFKKINDRLGHDAGDAVLVHVADILATSVRIDDTAARAGGEEFYVLLSDTGPTGAASFAERLRAQIEEHPVRFSGNDIAVTASIGVSLVDPADSDEHEVLKRADVALYEAKASGRNAVKVDWS